MKIEDFETHSIYKNKDGRIRIYDKKTHKVTSYPRFLMEANLGRPLSADEDVHHIDGDPCNNDISNLEIIKHGEHQKIHSTRFTDKEQKCAYCNQIFIWSGISQRNFYANKRRRPNARGPFCSRRCAALGSMLEHLDRDI